MAQMPRGNPRSVPDPAGELYDREMVRLRVERARREAQPQMKQVSSVGHPGFAESLIPVWGSGRESIADFQEGDIVGGVGNGVLAITDLALAGAIAKGVAKGGLKLGGSHTWNATTKWLKKKGFRETGEHGHHSFIPRGGWGKAVPDSIKNQPWNIKALDRETHGRIHGPYKGKSQFNAPQRYWYGTSHGSKAAQLSAAGHPAVSIRETKSREE